MAVTNTSEPLYFWRETDPATGWLSQWFFSPFHDDQDPNKVYYTAEHYMMHQKALLFNDAPMASRILQTRHPREAKSLGRKVAGFGEAAWLAHREAIVRRASLLKFARAPLRARLLATGFRERDAGGLREDWGLNLLGKALMEARTMLRDEDEAQEQQKVPSQS